jgi:hypothetical protein
LQKDLRRPAGLEVLGNKLQAGQPLQGGRVGVKKIVRLKRVMIRHRSNSLPNGYPGVNIVTSLVGEPGPIDIRFPLFLLRKNAHYGISGDLANVWRHHGVAPIQEPVEGEGADGGDGFSQKFPQFLIRRPSYQMAQHLMGHFVPHDQSQFIVIEAETNQPLGQDDFPRGSVGVNTVIFSVYQNGVFSREKLRIKGQIYFSVIPLN